jgi:glycosyltransferase involved in cell wall biosynthesis
VTALTANPRRRAPIAIASRQRVAIIHYWLVGMRGGERVLERLIRLFPDADLYTHVVVPAALSQIITSRPITTSFIQKLPGAAKHYQKYLPLMPMALEQFDLRGYDLVISSEAGPAKGVIAPPDAFHLCYCHSPMRYLWDHYPDYAAASGRVTRAAMACIFPLLRAWDVSSSTRVDRVAANSSFVQRRVRRCWGRESEIVHPPVDVSLFTRSAAPSARYLWVGQMTAYKRADLVVDAFNALGLPLLMVGDGELARRIRQRAGPSIQIVPKLGFAALREAYAQCRALIFTPEEDFGIVPIEAMAAGRPVLAYGRGGVLDTILPGETGLFFAEQTADSLIDGVRALEAWLPHFDPARGMAQAATFSPERFDDGIMNALRDR